MSTPKILIALTSHNQLGNTGQPTGFWLEEFTSPYYVFLDAGADITIASIQGGQPPIDPNSGKDDAQTESTRRFLGDDSAQAALAKTQPIESVNADSYDAIFLPGGHGTMWDFPDHASLIQLLESFEQQNKIIAAVCHAPAALVNVKSSSGDPLVKGKEVTAFTNIEEQAVALETIVPFMLETQLSALGATFKAGESWAPNIQQSDRLITGQNPASSKPAAQAVLAMLQSL